MKNVSTIFLGATLLSVAACGNNSGKQIETIRKIYILLMEVIKNTHRHQR